jgi:hypothetical protein
MSKLSAYLSGQKKQYLVDAEDHGGSADGFRKRIGEKYSDDPRFFGKLVYEALMEAATKKWEQQPRKRGPDLFAINGYAVPEFLTRQAFPAGDTEPEEDDEDLYEKVDQQFATVNDLYADATIKLRKAAQSGAAAELEMKAADEARRRARGNMAAYLRDVTDVAIRPGGPAPDGPRVTP